MAESKSVVIKLTNEQREAIRKATGQNIGELKVEALEGRVTPWSGDILESRKAPFAEDRKAPYGGDLEQRKAPFGLGEKEEVEARKAPFDLDPTIENRKAPFDLDPAASESRKAPIGVDTPAAESRKAPFSTE